MTIDIIRADALDLPIPDESVDLIVTSPPYFGLRSYTDAGEHYAGQIGSEPTPREFLDALIAATREMVRVLKPSGSIWVNLGDKYAANSDGYQRGARGSSRQPQVQPRTGAPTKSLLGLPWRYALRCIDDLGLILRAEVIWSKPNGLPESVTDRVRRSHETWFHFTREPRYYSAVDEIRESSTPQKGAAGTFRRERPSHDLVPGQTATQHRPDRPDVPAANPLGKLPGSVWTIPTQPLTVPAHLGVDHFAAYPMEWPRRLISGWCPREICSACGEGRRPVTGDGPLVGEGEYPQTRRALDLIYQHNIDVDQLRAIGFSGFKRWESGDGKHAGHLPLSSAEAAFCASLVDALGSYAVHAFAAINRRKGFVTGYVCDCADTGAATTPGVVLDPFGGTGTTALVAHALGRHGISVDLSEDYCRLARWRTTDPGQLAAAMQVEKPDAAPAGMDSLLDMIEEGA